MMSVMIVGGDNLGLIKKRLANSETTAISHVSGRNSKGRGKVSIGIDTALVIVMTDFISHNFALEVKRQAKKQGVPIIFAKRSWVAINEKLASLS